MKKSIVVIVTLFLGVVSYGQKKKDLINEVTKLKTQLAEMQQKIDAEAKAKEVNLEDEKQKFSYAFGVAVGNNLKIGGFGEDLSYNVIAKAIQEVIEGNERMALEQCLELVQSSFVEKQKEEAAKKSEEGAAFLAENGKREGVITTESGLQYEILTEGNGPIPKASDQVSVHYTGMLIDGKVFDSSVERGKPQVLGASQVIKGWQEALQKMPVGSKWKLFIPYDLAYGERGAGGAIPPYAALIFEIELLKIEDK